MDGDTFWAVFAPFLILGLPRWGAKRWLSFSLGKIAAVCLLGVGLLGAAIPAYFEGRRLQATIYDKQLPGSTAATAGEPIPPVVDEFPVRRAGVEHRIAFGPQKRTRDPRELPEVQISVVVLGPDGRQVASFDERFRAVDSSGDDEVYSWTYFDGRFTPAAAGAHRLVVTYRSADIPGLFVSIEDRSR